MFSKIFKNKKPKLKLKERLFLSFILLTSLSVLSISILFYLRSSHVLTDNTKMMTRQTMTQTTDYISYRLTSSKDISSKAYLDAEFKEMIRQFKKENDIQKKYNHYSRLTDMVSNMGMGRDVYSIRLYVDDSSIKGLARSTVMAESLIKNEAWYDDVLNERGGIIWLPTYKKDFSYPYDEQDIISIVRTIPDSNYNSQHLAVLVVDIKESTLNKIIEQVPITKRGEVYLMNQNGYVITSTNDEIKSTFVNLDDYMDRDKRFKTGESIRRIDNREVMVFHQKVPDMDWQLISIVPNEEIKQDATDILRFMSVVLIMVTALSAYVASRISKNITYRLEDLSDKMDLVKENKWDLDIDIPYDDEIGDLQRNFIFMTSQISDLIQEREQSSIDLRKAELRALQAQINPHFLYNILDLINWLAMEHGADDINDIVEKLARFFRLSLSSGKEMVPLRDEIEHIKLYVDIQNKRFDNSIYLNIDIEEEILDFYTINLILQPLVENSILHGINEKEVKKGDISIVGYQDIESLVIEVSDNGIGMSEEKIKEILSGEMSDGYGVRNVNERLTIRFGQTYGLRYISIPNEGTTAIVRIPIIRDLDDLNVK